MDAGLSHSSARSDYTTLFDAHAEPSPYGLIRCRYGEFWGSASGRIIDCNFAFLTMVVYSESGMVF